MFLFAVKYFAIVLFFLAVYALILGLKPGHGEGLKFKLDRLKARYLKETEQLVDKGDRTWDPERMLRTSLVAALSAAALGLLCGGFSAGGVFLALVFGAAGFLTPRLLLALGQQRRERSLNAQLPDALELIANSLRAGLSLVQALEVVSREAAQPVAGTFAGVVRDVRLGLAPEEALEKLILRWANADLELFVVAAEVSRRTGGNLAEVAGQIVATVRERARLKGRIAALTAQGVMSGWVVGLLPVGLLVAMSLLDPELIGGFLKHPLGWVMLGGGAVMELVGAFFIRKIVSIDV
jgi:tight adherence protein B